MKAIWHLMQILNFTWEKSKHKYYYKHCGLVMPYSNNNIARTGSTLVQLMACCLPTPSHYMNQCWLIIKAVPWHSPGSNFTRNAYGFNPYLFKLLPHLPGAQWVKSQDNYYKWYWIFSCIIHFTVCLFFISADHEITIHTTNVYLYTHSPYHDTKQWYIYK